MIQLLNGCYCGEFAVYPKNWKTASASLKKPWNFSYRFYDPLQREKYPKGYLRIIKGMNKTSSVKDRQKLTIELMQDELTLLKQQGFNPVTGLSFVPVEIDYEIDPATPFLIALQKACDRITGSKTKAYNLKSCLKNFSAAARQLRYDALQIQSIRRKHIYIILGQCEKIQERWSPQTFNHYRAYLMMMFKELRKLEAVETNPVLEIEKAPVKRKIKKELTPAERITIDKHLLENDPRFRMYMHIFFHSGSRIAELARMRSNDVDFNNQRFMITVEKGRERKEVWKPMKNIAYPFWVAMLDGCGHEDYIFSHNIMPGKKPALPEYFTKRWLRLIKRPVTKGGLGIDVDLYSLKHSNLDETAKIISIKRAKDMADHTSETTTRLYAQGEKAREDEDLKLVENHFVKTPGGH